MASSRKRAAFRNGVTIDTRTVSLTTHFRSQSAARPRAATTGGDDTSFAYVQQRPLERVSIPVPDLQPGQRVPVAGGTGDGTRLGRARPRESTVFHHRPCRGVVRAVRIRESGGRPMKQPFAREFPLQDFVSP